MAIQKCTIEIIYQGVVHGMASDGKPVDVPVRRFADTKALMRATEFYRSGERVALTAAELSE
jgi:hypothetical protein